MPQPSTPPSHILVLGGGLAAVRTAAELRERGFAGRLTVVADEPHAPYDRPPLSKELLTRTAPVELAGEGYGDLSELADELYRPARALRLDADDAGATVLVVGDGVGEEVGPSAQGGRHSAAGDRAPGGGDDRPHPGARLVGADVVVLATGAEAVVPAALAGALVLRSADDAAALRAALAGAPEEPVVIVGAGWIGAELASSLAAAGRAVTVLEAGPSPLAAQLGPGLGARTAPWYAEAGVALRTGALVAGLEDAPGGGHEVVLAGGERLRAGVVVAAVGARPATALVADVVRLDAGGAVLVHPDGRPVAGPAALRVVGDAATVVLPDGGTQPGGHWDAALHHPAALAAALLGAEPPEVPAASTFSTQFGREILTFGAPGVSAAAGARTVLREDATGWTALVIDDQRRLAGAVTVDHPRDVAPLRRALAGGRRPAVDPGALTDPAVPLKRLLPR